MPDRLLARDIVAASRVPLLVLDEGLVVLAASRSFGATFGTDEDAAVGSPLGRIANGRLKALAERLLRDAPGATTAEEFEIRDEAASGPRTFLIHTDAIGRDDGRRRALLLTLEDVTERRRREADRDDAVVRANDMLAELHHRAMNSFAMIGAILTMEARMQPDGACRAAFDRMQARIASIAHLYRTLGRDPSGETVGSDQYLRAIVGDLIASLSDPLCAVDASFAIAETPLPMRLAVPVGLIVNEIVTNSLKHAFTGRSRGRIRVELAPADGQYVLRISDDGRGFDAGARSTSGLGRRLSEAFVRQLRGTAEHASGPDGTTVVVRFPPATA